MAKVQYFGKYRAKVHSVNDPEKRGRIRVLCPKTLGEAVSNWCEPCIPVAYDSGGDFALPIVGETVWIEFEEGDVNKPIYVGNWWSKGTTPEPSTDTTVRCIEWKGCRIRMKPGTMELFVGSSKITITNSSIKLSSARIDLN